MSKAPKLIPMETWAAGRYNPAPSVWVLRRWCRDGEIFPAPEKVGREWYVQEDARRLTNGNAGTGSSLVERLQASAS